MEPLTPPVRRGIHEGLEIIANHMGQAVVSKELPIQLPQDARGYVWPERVKLSTLDKAVELHLLAVPLHPGTIDRVGAASEFGKAFVHSNIADTTAARIATAHETAHTFGFIRALAEHAHPEDRFHCSDTNCVMYPLLIHSIVRRRQQQHPLTNLAHKLFGVPDQIEEKIIYERRDFCQACKIDIRSFGNKQLELLHYMRSKKLLGDDNMQ